MTVLVPLACVALGIWQWQRARDDLQAMQLWRSQSWKVVSILEERAGPDGQLDMRQRFRRNGQTYAGPLALSEAREELGDADTAVMLSRWRGYLPPVVTASAALVAALSLVALVGAGLLGRAGRASRDALVRGFSIVRRLLPPLLATQVLFSALAIVAAILFESMALLEEGQFNTGMAKLLGIAAVVMVTSLWTAGRAIRQLRRTAALFTPDPLVIEGRLLTAAQAPGLWRLLDDLAGRLGALPPDSVVVGLQGGFFVSSGPKLLQPGDIATTGRTLYVPLPYLPLLREDEVAAIIGHELAHFAGGDTEYSMRFVPIYAGVGRSLDAVASAGVGADGSVSLLIRPTLRLGVWMMDQFHHAVRHWSRLREFAADADGARVTSTEAAGRALLRTSAAAPRIDAELAEAFGAPAKAALDLVEAVLRRAMADGLDDPSRHLEEEQPHPTDTHPPTRQRLLALGMTPEPARLAEAAARPSEAATFRLRSYFADPEALCRAASDDFLEAARDYAHDEHQALEAAAADVGPEELALYENTRPGGWILFGLGALLISMGLGVVALDMASLAGDGNWIILGVSGVLGLVFLIMGLAMLRRAKHPFLVLHPDHLTIRGLDAPVAWDDIADLDLTISNNSIVTRLLLPPGVPFPGRAPDATRRVKVDAGKRIVTLRSIVPKGLKIQGFADLLQRYRQAAEARKLLAAEHVAAPLRDGA